MFAAILHSVQVKFDEFRKTKLFTVKCYKVMTPVAINDELSAIVAAILHTGAGLIIVEEHILQSHV